MKITKLLLRSTALCFSLILFSCATKSGKYNSFDKNCYSLKKGMRVDEVLKIMGEPMWSGSQPLPGTSEVAQAYFFKDPFHFNKQLTTMFREDNLVQAKLSTQEGRYAETKDIIETNFSDFAPPSNQQSYRQPSSRNSTDRSLNLKDAKNELLDKYLRKEITKEEYFQLRRELEKR